MAKNFGNAASIKTFDNVAKASAEKANVITVKMISNENLFDYPKNHEDIQDTADLENSIKELGFTDPIEVTGFGQAEGNYMIVSGHRRRAAGVKCGMSLFPCIVKNFESETAVNNYVLLANSQRDSAKDPLLFCKRYRMHEEYLKASSFKGAAGEEIAKRLGIGVAQANRYKQFNKVILPVWDMVRDDVVGMSSVVSMGTFTPDEQEQILKMLNECIAAGETLTRDICKLIIDGYKDGKRTYAAVIENKHVLKDSGLPLFSFINDKPGESRERGEGNRNNEIRREFDPIAANADADDAAQAEWNRNHSENGEGAGIDGDEEKIQDGEQGEGGGEGEKGPRTSELEKQAKTAKDIVKYLGKLDTCFGNLYEFEDEEEAEGALLDMGKLFTIVVDEMYTIAREFNKQEVFKRELAAMKKKANEY